MKKVRRAWSIRNGIVFYSDIMPYLVIRSYIDENGKIQATKEATNSKRFIGPKVYCKRPFAFWFFLAMFCAFPIGLATFLSPVSIWTLIAIFLFELSSGSLFSTIVDAFFLKLGTGKCIARFHAAEHMIINAYHDLQRVPTLEELKRYSRFHEGCGSMSCFKMITLLDSLAILLVCLGHLDNYICIILIIASCCLLLVRLFRANLLKYLQVLLTSKPTEVEFEVALRGIQAYDEMEETFRHEMKSA